MSYKFYNLFAFIVVTILLLIMAFGCKTVKEVYKERKVYDSTAIRENKALRRFLSEEIERFEKERETWESTGVVFETDCDTVINQPTKIIYDNGKLKSIEGRIKIFNQDLIERTEELYDAHRQIDSLTTELERRETNVKTVEKIVTRDIKRSVLPGWIWFLLLAGWIGRGYWPRLKKYLGFVIKKGL